MDRIAEFDTLGLGALQAAIDLCAFSGGGRVIVPSGRHETAGILMRSGVELHLDPGAVLTFSDDPAYYPPVDTRWEGAQQKCHRPLIYAKGQQRLAITGFGTLEGKGKAWWKRFREGDLKFPRPCFVCFEDCEDVRLMDFRIQNSPAWTLHPLRCNNVQISGVTIVNPYDSPNTDGIDPESCQNVRILGCCIDVGDDCIAIKSGTEDAEAMVPCENIVVMGCTMVHGHGGVVLGSEMSGGIRRVSISGCVFNGTDRGLRLKSRRGRGGVIEDVQASDIIMHDVLCPLVINTRYYCGPRGKDPSVSAERMEADEKTPRVRRIIMRNVQATGVRSAAACLIGLPEAPLEDILFSDSWVEMVKATPEVPVMMDGMEARTQAGLIARNVKRLTLTGLQIRGIAGREHEFENVEEEKTL